MDIGLITILQHYGFSEKEAKIYLTTLELGSSPASSIARNSGIKRVTAYTLLKDLKNKGIATTIKRKEITYFSVVSPQILLEQLEQKYLAFKEKAPELMSIVEKIGTAPKIKYLEGPAGLALLFADFASTQENMRTILGTNKKHKEAFAHISGQYRLARQKKGLIARRIVTADDTDIKKERLDDKKYSRKTVVISDFPLPINADINIYGPGKISILFFDINNSPHAIIIENNEVYTTLVGIFEYLRKLHTTKTKNK